MYLVGLAQIVITDSWPDLNTKSFIYANDLAIVTQGRNFGHFEKILTSSLHNLSEYYRNNCLKTNPAKTQTCAFHLNTREATRKFKITGKILRWNTQTSQST